jgi:hypothetical protein
MVRGDGIQSRIYCCGRSNSVGAGEFDCCGGRGYSIGHDKLISNIPVHNHMQQIQKARGLRFRVLIAERSVGPNRAGLLNRL